MANWNKKDYYKESESENEEEVAVEKLKETTDLLQDSDLFPEFQQEDLNYNQLTEDELLEVIERDSPEMMGVLETIQNFVKVFRRAQKNKNEITLKYCKLLATHLSYYLLLKSRGKIAANHPVVMSIKNIEKIISAREATVQDRKHKKAETKEYKGKDPKENLTNDHKEKEKDQKRAVDEKIKKNKGIVKKRKKIERNVRVKNKMKYLKKVKYRRATLGIREAADQSKYQGEATGIRKNLVKSVKLT